MTDHTWQPQAGEPIRAKGLMDTAKSLPEAAQMLEEFAARLRAIHDQGWRLLEPVDSDYGFLVDPDGHNGDLDT